jgi:hypothetical protein
MAFHTHDLLWAASSGICDLGCGISPMGNEELTMDLPRASLRSSCLTSRFKQSHSLWRRCGVVLGIAWDQICILPTMNSPWGLLCGQTKRNIPRASSFIFLFGLFAWQPVRSREIGGRWFVQTAVMQLECADSPGPDSVDVGFSLSKKICNFFYFRAQEE